MGRFTDGGGFCGLRDCDGNLTDLLEADLGNKGAGFFIDGGGLSRLRYCDGRRSLTRKAI